jgi:hypothetical protein
MDLNSNTFAVYKMGLNSNTFSFPLLLKFAAQKEKIDWNSSMSSSRLHVAMVSFLWCMESSAVPFR